MRGDDAGRPDVDKRRDEAVAPRGVLRGQLAPGSAHGAAQPFGPRLQVRGDLCGRRDFGYGRLDARPHVPACFERRGGLAGAQERAGDDRQRVDAVQPCGGRGGLVAAYGVESRVARFVETGARPSVADEVQGRRGHVGIQGAGLSSDRPLEGAAAGAPFEGVSASTSAAKASIYVCRNSVRSVAASDSNRAISAVQTAGS